MMSEVLIILAWLLPLLLAAVAAIAPRFSWQSMFFAGLPGLLTPLSVPVGSVIDISFLLLGSRFGLDQLGMGFLLFTSVIWTLAAWHARGYIAVRWNSFTVYFLLAMSGNFGLILAQDMVGFYFFFALMSFASYGLVIHERTEAVRHAGLVYIVLVVIGEVLIFSGMAGVATLAGGITFAGLDPTWVNQGRGALFFGALFLGFGIKAGALPLHVWLPLAHPAAPTPASAVLSGAMIKAGLLGWLRFLPIGEVSLPEWGMLFMGLGAVAFIGAALYGCMQSNAKALLAYSSISKMGLMTIAVGVILAEPGAATVVIPCILIFATHHCFCKGALFLSVSIEPNSISPGPLRWFTVIFLFIPPLSLAGFALTSGALAKSVMKTGLLNSLGTMAGDALSLLILINSLLTATLMFRFCLQRLRATPHAQQPLQKASYTAWGVAVAVVIVSPLLLQSVYPEISMALFWNITALWDAVWPVALVVGIGTFLVYRSGAVSICWPSGDLLFGYVYLTRRSLLVIQKALDVWAAVSTKIIHGQIIPPQFFGRLLSLLRRAESGLGMAMVFGLVFLGLLTLSTYLLFTQV